MNIYEKMLAITNEMKSVAKNLEVGYGKNSYKAVGEADVLHAVKALEGKHKIYSYPYKREILESSILSTEKEYNGKVTKGNQIFLRLLTVYRFVNTENPEEYVDITSYGDGIDTQDKAVGKAMTYSDKYALMKAYKIITGEDPDQFHSPDNVTYSAQSGRNSTELRLLLENAGVDVDDVLKKKNIKSLDELSDAEFYSYKSKAEKMIDGGEK